MVGGTGIESVAPAVWRQQVGPLLRAGHERSWLLQRRTQQMRSGDSAYELAPFRPACTENARN